MKTSGRLNRGILPVFPLDLVLFPRQELPLRIFEPRYKQMVEDCMTGDGLFGVCLADRGRDVMGWEAPVRVGTVAKITECKDAGLDGLQLDIQSMGRNRFRTRKLIPPSLALPPDYDPHTLEGHRAVSDLHEGANPEDKMYLRAQVDMLPEIDEHVPTSGWQELVDMWKKKVQREALPEEIRGHMLDALLERYYLLTETPTIDYVYSLAALGSAGPADLQPILEADTMDDLMRLLRELMTVK